MLQLWRLDLISGLLRCSDVSCPFDFRSVQVAPIGTEVILMAAPHFADMDPDPVQYGPVGFSG